MAKGVTLCPSPNRGANDALAGSRQSLFPALLLVLRVRAMVNEGENKAILWIKDENKIQRDLIHRRNGKISVIERDLSGGQRALIHILRNEYPPSRELCNMLASALEPIGNSVLQIIKRLRRRPGRPSKIDGIKGAINDAIELHDFGPETERERKHPSTKRPQAAIGMKQKKPTRKDAIKIIASKKKIGLTTAYLIDKRYRNFLKNKTK
jgi:hypothetical protein